MTRRQPWYALVQVTDTGDHYTIVVSCRHQFHRRKKVPPEEMAGVINEMMAAIDPACATKTARNCDHCYRPKWLASLIHAGPFLMVCPQSCDPRPLRERTFQPTRF